MGIAQENKYTNLTGSFPDAVMIDASGAGLTDGSEFAALPLNDGWEPFQQSVMDYADGGTNDPTGSVGVPNGVADAKEVSQMIEAIQKGNGIGPGFYVQYGKDDDPSVTGDRVLLLAEQGVLVATYPDLDRETWIGGNTAAQVAAEAAGEKFYRSSDAGGATGDAAGPYLQLPTANPTFLKQYSEANGDFTVTGTGWTTAAAVIVPYQISDGTWRMAFNIQGNVTSSTRTFYSITINTVALSFTSACSGYHDNIPGAGGQTRISTSGAIRMDHISQTTTLYQFSGDVPLSSKPTFADDFSFPWGITY